MDLVAQLLAKTLVVQNGLHGADAGDKRLVLRPILIGTKQDSARPVA